MLEGIKNWKRRREDEKMKARWTAVTKFAAASGLSYSVTDRNVIDKLRTVSIEAFLFPDGSIGSWPPTEFSIENMLSGQWQGLPVAEADCETSAARVDQTFSGAWIPFPAGPAVSLHTKRYSAVIADLPAALPDLMIQRTIPLVGDLQAKLAVAGYQAPRYHIESGFDREWWVTTANTAFAAKLIDASMITWLLSESGAFLFKLHSRNLLLVWRYLLEASDLGAIFDTAKSFTDHIQHQILAEYGTR